MLVFVMRLPCEQTQRIQDRSNAEWKRSAAECGCAGWSKGWVSGRLSTGWPQEESLAGFIGNDTDGVTIEIEGPTARVEAFLARLRAETPPLARIDSVAVRELAAIGEAGFRIVSSQVKGQVSTGIPADAATCADCLRELLDPADRRYRYPFLNCTNCGPRFTITRRIPYDRPQTSMAKFPMCAACQAEYDDPLNRRFHAQPNACWVCGPRVWLEAPDGNGDSRRGRRCGND